MRLCFALALAVGVSSAFAAEDLTVLKPGPTDTPIPDLTRDVGPPSTVATARPGMRRKMALSVNNHRSATIAIHAFSRPGD